MKTTSQFMPGWLVYLGYFIMFMSLLTYVVKALPGH